MKGLSDLEFVKPAYVFSTCELSSFLDGRRLFDEDVSGDIINRLIDTRYVR